MAENDRMTFLGHSDYDINKIRRENTPKAQDLIEAERLSSELGIDVRHIVRGVYAIHELDNFFQRPLTPEVRKVLVWHYLQRSGIPLYRISHVEGWGVDILDDAISDLEFSDDPDKIYLRELFIQISGLGEDSDGEKKPDAYRDFADIVEERDLDGKGLLRVIKEEYPAYPEEKRKVLESYLKAERFAKRWPDFSLREALSQKKFSGKVRELRALGFGNAYIAELLGVNKQYVEKIISNMLSTGEVETLSGRYRRPMHTFSPYEALRITIAVKRAKKRGGSPRDIMKSLGLSLRFYKSAIARLIADDHLFSYDYLNRQQKAVIVDQFIRLKRDYPGMTYEEIAKALQLPVHAIEEIYYQLHTSGEIKPLRKKISRSHIDNAISEAGHDPQKIKKAFELVDSNYFTRRTGKEFQLVTLSSLLRPFFSYNSLPGIFRVILEENGIVVGSCLKKKYKGEESSISRIMFLLVSQAEEALRILLADDRTIPYRKDRANP